MELKEYKYKNDKRTVYGLDVTIPNSYEVYIDDILVKKENETGMHNTLININQAILKSGKYKFRIKVYPEPQELAKGGIQPETLSFMKVGLAKYEKIPEGEGAMPDTYEYVKSYPVEKIDKPIPYYEIKGEFTAEVPYDLEGWSKGRDLRKMDQKVLKEKVVAYYQKLWNILNNGEGSEFVKLWQKADQETVIFNYSNSDYLKGLNNEEINEINERKGRMAKLEDYEMKTYGNGKLVTLERKNHSKEINSKPFDIMGKSPLIRNGKVKGISTFPITLYLPQNSNEFVIIRK